ncbi:hypothetical protein B0J11DRAFT_593966 [Dendryphion nanum]|uniref:Uncharacterized protein n=1 Tax=Dendryphion nanum TaxID=256645 RepID=A0A9P9DCA0_9PLEO|nr:hypothetical protein B0J11DRAFT_593966 [Dendryphion nanum]
MENTVRTPTLSINSQLKNSFSTYNFTDHLCSRLPQELLLEISRHLLNEPEIKSINHAKSLRHFRPEVFLSDASETIEPLSNAFLFKEGNVPGLLLFQEGVICSQFKMDIVTAYYEHPISIGSVLRATDIGKFLTLDLFHIGISRAHRIVPGICIRNTIDDMALQMGSFRKDFAPLLSGNVSLAMDCKISIVVEVGSDLSEWAYIKISGIARALQPIFVALKSRNVGVSFTVVVKRTGGDVMWDFTFLALGERDALAGEPCKSVTFAGYKLCNMMQEGGGLRNVSDRRMYEISYMTEKQNFQRKGSLNSFY